MAYFVKRAATAARWCSHIPKASATASTIAAVTSHLVLTRRKPNMLWNNEDFIGPRIFYFAARCVTAYIDISSACIEGAEDVSRLVGDRLSYRKFQLCRGSARQWRRLWFSLRRLLATHT